jgi:DNA-3-methyladenine glycosylase II
MELITDERVLRRAAEHLAGRDRVMANLIERHGVSRMTPWQNEPFTALIGAIISQQLSVKAADTIEKRVLKLAGRGGRFIASRLLAASDDELRACGLSGAKTRYIKGIAEAAQAGQLNLKRVRELPDDELIESLTALKGIGIWTAEMLMIFAFGHPDVMSLGDLGLRKGIEVAYELDHRPSDKVMLGTAEVWRPYRSVASWYLWRAAESGPIN